MVAWFVSRYLLHRFLWTLAFSSLVSHATFHHLSRWNCFKALILPSYFISPVYPIHIMLIQLAKQVKRVYRHHRLPIFMYLPLFSAHSTNSFWQLNNYFWRLNNYFGNWTLIFGNIHNFCWQLGHSFLAKDPIFLYLATFISEANLVVFVRMNWINLMIVSFSMVSKHSALLLHIMHGGWPRLT